MRDVGVQRFGQLRRRAGVARIVHGADHGLDRRLGPDGELPTAGAEELDAVVLGRVVRRRDHDPDVAVEQVHQVRDRRGRQDPAEQHVGTGPRRAVDERALDTRPRGAGVTSDDDPRRRGAFTRPDGDGPSDVADEVVAQLRVGVPADAVGSEEFAHEDGPGEGRRSVSHSPAQRADQAAGRERRAAHRRRAAR